MKYILTALLFVISITASATERRTTINNTYNSYSESMSLGMAMAGIDFGTTSAGTQIGISGAVYEDSRSNQSSAVAIGVGKRVCKSEGSCGLIKFSGGINEGGGKGFNAGFMWNL